MKKLRLTVILAISSLAVILAISQVSAQIFTPSKSSATEPIILIDAAAFAIPNSDSVRLELYYQIYNFGLQFKEIGGEWVASYELSVVVLDDDKIQVGADEKSKEIRLASGERTKSKFDHRTSQINFNVNPGKY